MERAAKDEVEEDKNDEDGLGIMKGEEEEGAVDGVEESEEVGEVDRSEELGEDEVEEASSGSISHPRTSTTWIILSRLASRPSSCGWRFSLVSLAHIFWAFSRTA